MLVVPPVIPLPSIEIATDDRIGEGGMKVATPRRTVTASGVREYVPGDSLYSIHWMTSARLDNLYVRMFDRMPTSDWWVFVDMDEKVRVGEEAEATEEYGIIMAASIAAYFQQPSTQDLLTRLKKVNVNMIEPVEVKGQKLAGQKFVFTGELIGLARSQAKALVKRLGGEVVSSVSHNVDFVVIGNSPGSKYKKAQDLGIKILKQNQFQEMVYEKE